MGMTPPDGMVITTSATTFDMPKPERHVPLSSRRPKFLGFSQLAQSVKTPHLDLSRFDLEWGPRKPWAQVVKEWRGEQLTIAAERRKKAVAMRKCHLEE